jgi:hypothetical protein
MPDVPQPEARIRIYANTFLGDGRYMTTNGELKANGEIFAATRTRIVTWFGSFHGAVKLLMANSDEVVIDMSPGTHTFGVDGTSIGISDRTDSWTDRIKEANARETQSVTVCHYWDPDNFDQRLANLGVLTKRLDVVTSTLADIAKFATTFL